MLEDGVDYEKLGLRSYRLIKDISKKTNSRPPNGKGLLTKFGYLDDDGLLTLYAGFCWDGATGALDTNDIMRASAFHDWFCNNVLNRSLPSSYRREGDDLFYIIMLEDGAPRWRAIYAHGAVVLYGKMVVRMLES